MNGRRRLLLGAGVLACVGGLVLLAAWLLDEPAATGGAQVAAQSRPGTRDLRGGGVRGTGARPARIGDLYQDQDRDSSGAAPPPTRVEARPAAEGSPERAWDTMSSLERMTYARREVESALAGVRGGAEGERAAAAAAELLAAARADFFATPEGEAEYRALEERIGG